jgi:hypothetical protein
MNAAAPESTVLLQHGVAKVIVDRAFVAVVCGGLVVTVLANAALLGFHVLP